jgi:uncharacterized protein YhfF
MRTPATDDYWSTFRASAGLDASAGYEVVAFGDSPEMSDELAALVLHGPKRATAGLLRDFASGGESMPVSGGYVIVVDGRGAPRCIWRTTEVAVKPLDQVDATFAWDEGEGDRTLAWWLDAHRRYFRRQGEREGFVFDDSLPVVLERFIVVWPPEVADRG